MVNLLGWIVRVSGGQIRKIQTGRISTYLAGMTVSVIVLVIFVSFMF
jgi:hypothetical protein